MNFTKEQIDFIHKVFTERYKGGMYGVAYEIYCDLMKLSNAIVDRESFEKILLEGKEEVNSIEKYIKDIVKLTWELGYAHAYYDGEEEDKELDEEELKHLMNESIKPRLDELYKKFTE